MAELVDDVQFAFKQCNLLHDVICQAVQLMNNELQDSDGNRKAHTILREALVAYADSIPARPARLAIEAAINEGISCGHEPTVMSSDGVSRCAKCHAIFSGKASPSPTVEAAESNFSEKFWEIVNGAIGDWGGAHDVITMTRRAAYREAYDLIAAEFAKSESMPAPAPAPSAAEIRRQACTWQMDSWDEAELWETDCGQTWQFETGTPTDNKMSYCCYCGKPLKQRINMHFRERDAAPTPPSKNSGDEATGD
jgi:hypothetical protein